ncbi:MAG TPA: hypothetical protein VE732_07060 [Nitrososphaera sp.]|nr:hypothetical protein [Nitrososphaera sp.]
MLNYFLTLILLSNLSSHVSKTLITDESVKPISICELLENRKLYNGKMVAVVGIFSAGYHGAWLVDNCEQKIKTGDYVWSSSLWLEYDDSLPSVSTKGLSVDTMAAIEKAKERKQHIDSRKWGSRWVVVYGRFETYEELQTYTPSNGKTIYELGFGHLNSSPGQLVYNYIKKAR